jgi:anti-sigma factor RsiW
MANRDQTPQRANIPCPLTSGESDAAMLLDYCNRRLDPESTALLERHIRQCPACEAFASSQALLWQTLDAYEAMPVSQDFDRSLYARIDAEQQKPTWTRLWLQLWNRFTMGGTLTGAQLWRPALPVAACLLVAAGLYLRPGMESAHSPDVAGVAGVESSIQAEQIETALEDMEMLRDLGALEVGGQRQM